eukprot:scaffold119827_cov45-Phaeocystis_antarctica.AAC.1
MHRQESKLCNKYRGVRLPPLRPAITASIARAPDKPAHAPVSLALDQLCEGVEHLPFDLVRTLLRLARLVVE